MKLRWKLVIINSLLTNLNFLVLVDLKEMKKKLTQNAGNVF